MSHIGIVACTAEGASLCYRTIVIESGRVLGKHVHPEVSLHTHSLSDYVACLDRNDVDGVADLMLSSAEKLARAGADFLICPDNTIHEAMPLVEPRSPRPWLHIARVVGDEAKRRGFRRVGLTGTRWLVDGPVYPDALHRAGIETVRPMQSDRDEINRIIMEELVEGRFHESSRAFIHDAIGRFTERGCDAVVLGCTELPLIVDDSQSVLSTLDSTRLLARAAVRAAVDGVGLTR